MSRRVGVVPTSAAAPMLALVDAAMAETPPSVAELWCSLEQIEFECASVLEHVGRQVSPMGHRRRALLKARFWRRAARCANP